MTTTINNGVATPRVTNLPAATNFNIPTFSFDLLTSAADDGEFKFKVGVVIFEDSTTGTSNNRLEVFLPEMVLNVSGTAVNGSIPAQTMTVVGRNGSVTGTSQLANANTNGPISINGNQVTFSGARLVERLTQADPAFNAVLAAFNTNGNYTYRVTIQQTNGSTARFGRTVGARFSPLPQVRTTCTLNTASQLSSLFELAGSVNNGTQNFRVRDQFTSAYAVQGQFSVGPGTNAAVAPAPFTDTCDTQPASTPSPDFFITGGELRLSTTNFPEVTTTIGINGVATPRVVGLPVSTSFNIPTFNFDLLTSTTSNGDYKFKVGVAIFEDSPSGSNNNRLEVFLPEMVLNVSDTAITGSIPSQTMTVVGRNGSLTGTSQLVNSSNNGPISISGGRVTFSGAQLVSRLTTADPAFNAVLNAFNTNGNYTYRVIIQQTDASAGRIARFGRSVSGSFSAFPQVRTTCSANTPSQLSSLFILAGSVTNGTVDFRVRD